ncbi:hypothetical protein V7O62_00835 [Methanolobus sp. ZRKC2]|uniref:hypothetical protein n=1 Tax=Methanolobus sp. ZRKC2 TaxID=3125783 RepID=UPI003245A555
MVEQFRKKAQVIRISILVQSSLALHSSMPSTADRLVDTLRMPMQRSQPQRCRLLYTTGCINTEIETEKL